MQTAKLTKKQEIRGENMKTLENAQDDFMFRIGKIFDSFGFNKFIFQLYSVLYLNEDAMSLDEIADRLKVSKGNVSINIRELEQWGAVEKVWVKGSRRDYYKANLNIKKLFISKVKTGVNKRLNEINSILEDFKSTIDAKKNGSSEEEKRTLGVYRDRFKRIQELKAFLERIWLVAEKIL